MQGGRGLRRAGDRRWIRLGSRIRPRDRDPRRTASRCVPCGSMPTGGPIMRVGIMPCGIGGGPLGRGTLLACMYCTGGTGPDGAICMSGGPAMGRLTPRLAGPIPPPATIIGTFACGWMSSEARRGEASRGRLGGQCQHNELSSQRRLRARSRPDLTGAQCVLAPQHNLSVGVLAPGVLGKAVVEVVGDVGPWHALVARTKDHRPGA